MLPSRQQERGRGTRQRLLEATVDCLVQRGWAGTTTTVVAERAGVSRGAQLHHFPTKSDLVTAAVRHLAERRGEELRAEAAALTGGRPTPTGPAGPGGPTGTEYRVDRTVDLLASVFTGPLYTAALEVWVAARTDPPLRAALLPVEAALGRQVHRLTVDLLDADESVPGVREAVQATLDLLRGLGLATLLTDDSERSGRLLRAHKRQLAAALAAVPVGAGTGAGTGASAGAGAGGRNGPVR
ncbi:MAG TPA: TetR/AcrR family transcriptional regulator [Mycobacteriales bacterium]|nr:TetR/AcrR family transcriptional regulator [Mycobacteriales bacterium]